MLSHLLGWLGLNTVAKHALSEVQGLLGALHLLGTFDPGRNSLSLLRGNLGVALLLAAAIASRAPSSMI